jgi:hypothetical protein
MNFIKSTIYSLCAFATLGANATDFTDETFGYKIVSTKEKTVSVDDLLTEAKSVIIPNTVVYGNITFKVIGLDGLISYSNPNTNYKNVEKLSLGENVKYLGSGALSSCESLSNISFNSALDSIGSRALQNCAFTSIEMPATVRVLATDVFSDSKKLTTVTFKNPNTILGSGLFDNCPNLTTINFPENLAEIPYDCCRYCTSLTSVEIPDNVKKIGSDAFNGCSNLSKCNFPDKLQNIGSYAFYKSNLSGDIKLPDSLDNIEMYAFSGTNISSVTLPNNFSTIIEDRAFQDCANLSIITIQNNGLTFKDRCFYNCNSISVINSYNMVPPKIGSYFIPTLNYITASLNIRKGAKTTYENADGWSEFVNINETYEWKETFDVTMSFQGPDVWLQTMDIVYPEDKRNHVVMDGNYFVYDDIASVRPENGYRLFFNDVELTRDDLVYSYAQGTNYISGLKYITAPIHKNSTLLVTYGTESGIQATTSNEVNVYCRNGRIEIANNDGNKPISVYNTNGTLYYSGYQTNVPLSKEGIYFVKIGEKTFKILNK